MMNFDNTTVEAAKRFEPIEAFELNERTERALNVTTLMSIAISLKRIADKLELAYKQPIIMTAEEMLKYYKDKDGC